MGCRARHADIACRRARWENPGWHIAFDANPQAAEAIRRNTFDRVVADKIVCTGYHWGMPGAGSIAKDGNG